MCPHHNTYNVQELYGGGGGGGGGGALGTRLGGGGGGRFSTGLKWAERTLN